MVGLAWVKRVCGGGSMAGVSSSELKRGSGGVLKWGSMEKAKGGEESLAGAFMVLVCALGEGGGLYSGRSTAALRWRPRGGSGRRGEAGRLQRKPRRAVGSIRAMRGSQCDAERGRGRPSTAGGAAQRRRQESRGRTWRWKKKDPNAISKNSRDQSVN